MLDYAVGVGGQHIVDGETTWRVPSWTLGALGALRNHIFQKALQTTFVDGLADHAQAADRAVLRRLYAIGNQFEPYRLIYDGALDEEDNLAVFLHELLLKNHSAMTIGATRELVKKHWGKCITAVLNANPRMPLPSPADGTVAGTDEAAKATLAEEPGQANPPSTSGGQ